MVRPVNPFADSRYPASYVVDMLVFFQARRFQPPPPPAVVISTLAAIVSINISPSSTRVYGFPTGGFYKRRLKLIDVRLILLSVLSILCLGGKPRVN